jgi:hypothetical protein
MSDYMIRADIFVTVENVTIWLYSNIVGQFFGILLLIDVTLLLSKTLEK